MHRYQNKSVIYTVRDRCRVCFTCVRECPAKAIRIIDGQAEVLMERCIGCGNCVKVCSQKAKKGIESIDAVFSILDSDTEVVAIVAPSFPAEFPQMHYGKFVASLRRLGFDYVHEVALGADYVAQEYKKLLTENKDKSYIATTCPAIVSYVEKYYPELVDHLAPIVSPMIATARLIKEKKGENIKIIFIGPCIAKKSEILRNDLYGEVDEVMTFGEVAECFKMKNIAMQYMDESDFDPPYAKKGSLFPISRGMLQAAGIEEDLVNCDVVSASGRANFNEAIKEYKAGFLNTRLLELLSCDGCIMGAGITSDIPLYQRRYLVGQYAKKSMKRDFTRQEQSKTCDFTCCFSVDDQRIATPEFKEIEMILKNMGKKNPEDELNCGACGYETCREHAIAIYKGLAENEMCLPYTIEKLKDTVYDLEKSYGELKSVREALNQREKLASMGQLAAGIAHELNNPLGVVLVYSHILMEEFGKDEVLNKDVSIIVEQANRCKKIVSGLLNFARQNKVFKEPVNIVNLISHCLEAISIPSDIFVDIRDNMTDLLVELDKEQFSQVILNIVNNAIDAMEDINDVQRSLIIEIEEISERVKIKITDTGSGIQNKIINKIFDPFFTTKQIGKGTGLGLPVSYGIIKMHSGDIKVKSNCDPKIGKTGTTIEIVLPKRDMRNI